MLLDQLQSKELRKEPSTIYISKFICNSKKMNKPLYNNIYDKYKTYGYDNKDIFQIDVDFLLDLYDIQLIELLELTETKRKIRTKQAKFRQQLIERDKCCLVTGNDFVECDGAHIVPVSESNNYHIDNGLLLTKSLHDTFDKHFWCIDPTDPNNLKIVLNNKLIMNKKLACCQYNGQTIKFNITLSKTMLENLTNRYKAFLSIC